MSSTVASAVRTATAVAVGPRGTPWVCPTSPCPAVIGRYLVFRDTQHLATSFAAALASRLLAMLPAISR